MRDRHHHHHHYQEYHYNVPQNFCSSTLEQTSIPFDFNMSKLAGPTTRHGTRYTILSVNSAIAKKMADSGSTAPMDGQILRETLREFHENIRPDFICLCDMTRFQGSNNYQAEFGRLVEEALPGSSHATRSGYASVWNIEGNFSKLIKETMYEVPTGHDIQMHCLVFLVGSPSGS